MKIYQYIGPLIFTPLSYFLWKNYYHNESLLFWLAFLSPILWAYIIPGIGTNLLGVWEFNVKLKLGKFRPQHGFVFGSATGVLTYLMHARCESLSDAFRFAVLLGSFLAYWNTLYDIRALKQGIVQIYNRPYVMDLGPEAIVLDYAPIVFGYFGFFYALCIGTAEYLFRNQPAMLETNLSQILFFIIAQIIILVLPIAFFSIKSYIKYGDHGLYKHTK